MEKLCRTIQRFFAMWINRRHLKTRTTNHNAGGAHQTGSEASLYRPLYTSPGHLVA